MNRYAHLKIKVSFLWYLKKYLLKITSWFFLIPFVAKACRVIGRSFTFLGNMEYDKKKMHKQLELLADDHEDAQKTGSGYGYGGDIDELITISKYRTQLKSPDFEKIKAESPAVYHNAIQEISKLIENDNRIKHVIDFGVGYGYLNSVLAKKYPHVTFIGIDRSPLTKLYNEYEFPNIKNLEFVADDIFNLLNEGMYEGGLFVHIRTSLLLSKKNVEKLYNTVGRRGLNYIFGIEPHGISRHSLKSYEFSENEKPSEWFRGPMYIHNYPELLKRAGFALEKIDLVKTSHPHEDYRLLTFVAKKISGPANT